MKQRNWIWVVIFAAIFAGCLALWLLPRGGGETVLVYQDGQLLRTLDLRQDTVFTVEGPAGENTVTVAAERSSAVWMSAAVSSLTVSLPVLHLASSASGS